MKNAWKILGVRLYPLVLLPRKVVVALIRLYQKTLSYDHGPLKYLYPYGFCRFTPTCSEYGAQVITKYGVLRGIPLAAWRVARCNPCSRGGIDKVK